MAGLLGHAASLCGARLLASAGLIAFGLLMTLLLARPARGRGLNLALALGLWGALLWSVRDTQHLLGDARVWIANAEALGARLPAYRAPGSAFLLGILVDATRGLLSTEHVLAGTAVASGLAVFGILRSWALEASTPAARRWVPAAAATLVFAQPLGFVFFGHIEPYAFFAVPFTLFLVWWADDIEHQRLRPRTVIALLAAATLHLAGALAGAAVLARFAARGPRARRRGWIAFALLMLVPATVLLAVPALRGYSFLAREWTVPDAVDYAWDVLNMWTAALLPGLFLLVRRRRRMSSADDGLTQVFVAFLLFPVVAYFSLGGLRDLDIMTPAALAMAVWVLRGLARRDRPRAPDAAIAALCLVMTAALITMTRCPAGALELERHLHRGAMPAEGRANTAEVLSFFHRERHDLPRAQRFIEEALAATPGNHRLYGPLGEIQAARGDTLGAIRSLTLALDSPREERTLAYLGRLLTDSGRPREAVAVIRERGDLAITRGDVNAALVVAYLRIGQPDSALAAIDRRLSYEPDDAVAYFNAGAALSRLGEPGAALEAVERALALDPTNPVYQATRRRLVEAMGGGS